MKGKWKSRGAALALAAVVLGGAATVYATQGSQSDPLVSLSYLTDVLTPSILNQVDAKLAAKEQAYVDKLQQVADGYVAEMEALVGQGVGGSASVFTVVDLAQGKTLTGAVGCELMLRVGSANCVSPASPGLIDSTDGSTLEGGRALVKNHLYLVTVEGRGITATSAVKVLVRGSYTIG